MATVVNHALTLPQQLAKKTLKTGIGKPVSRAPFTAGQTAWLNGLKRNAAAAGQPPGGAIPSPHLSGGQIANYAAQENTANNQYQHQIADYEFNRANENQAFTANNANLTQQYARMREALPGNAQSRGLLTSGIYGQSLQDYGNQRVQALSQLLQGHQQQLGSLDLGRSQAEDSRKTQLAQIAAQRAAQQQALALQYGQKR